MLRKSLIVMLTATLVVAAAPGEATAGRPVRVYTDIAYAPAQPATSRGHLLDLYVPAGPGRHPLLIVMGGSGWFGDEGKAYAADLAPFFTARGYVVAGVSTRSSTQARFPAQVQDVKAAIRWLRAHARQFHLDPARVAAMGDSSGGWTAAMAGLTGRARDNDNLQAVVDLYGPTDFLQMDPHMLPGACESFNQIFGLTDCHRDPRSPESSLLGCPIESCPDLVRAADPSTHVSRGDPPFLIAHGRADTLVPHHQSELLFAALVAACVPATFYSVPGIGHDRAIVAPTTPAATVQRNAGCRAKSATGRPTLPTIDNFLEQAFSSKNR